MSKRSILLGVSSDCADALDGRLFASVPFDRAGDEIIIEGTDRTVYRTERVAISDCAWPLTPPAQYESQKVEDRA